MHKIIFALLLVSTLGHSSEVEFEERFVVEPQSYTLEGLKTFLDSLGPGWSLTESKGQLIPTFCMAKHSPEMCLYMPPELFKQFFEHVSNQVHL